MTKVSTVDKLDVSVLRRQRFYVWCLNLVLKVFRGAPAFLGFFLAALTSQKVTSSFSQLIHSEIPGDDFSCQRELFDINDKKVIELYTILT